MRKKLWMLARARMFEVSLGSRHRQNMRLNFIQVGFTKTKNPARFVRFVSDSFRSSTIHFRSSHNLYHSATSHTSLFLCMVCITWTKWCDWDNADVSAKWANVGLIAFQCKAERQIFDSEYRTTLSNPSNVELARTRWRKRDKLWTWFSIMWCPIGWDAWARTLDYLFSIPTKTRIVEFYSIAQQHSMALN